MKNVVALAFTDIEVQEICNSYEAGSIPEYTGGNVFVVLPTKDSKNQTWVSFVDVLNEVHPELHVNPKSIAVYDYGNVIFNDGNIACVVMNV